MFELIEAAIDAVGAAFEKFWDTRSVALFFTGISKITVTIVTQPIPLKTPNTTPSGYLNFIKQKVIVDSAVSSINNKALVSPVGTFLANAPQPVTLAPEICCLNPSTQ